MPQLRATPHSPTPWRITEATEKKGREIVDARGNTVAKLTALDLPNAQVMVDGVNLLHHNRQGIRLITDPTQLEAGRDYWMRGKTLDVTFIATCREDDSCNKKYFGNYIWAEPDNNQAMERFEIYGPLPTVVPPDFEALKQAG
jgi:hypothetical protein